MFNKYNKLNTCHLIKTGVDCSDPHRVNEKCFKSGKGSTAVILPMILSPISFLVLSLRLTVSALLLALPLLSLAVTLPQRGPTSTPSPSLFRYQNFPFSYFSNLPLDRPHSSIKQAIVVIHGSDRNADTYFEVMDDLTRQEQVDQTTVVIAPHFKLATDPLVANEYTWTDESWLRGGPSENHAPISSFEIIDSMIHSLVKSGFFPALQKIVIVGHSAGGQFTQRYALGTLLDQQLPQIRFRFIPTNPGSFVYLSPNRPIFKNGVPPSEGQPVPFGVPAHPLCAYNDYKYGLDHLVPYFFGPSSLRANLNVLRHELILRYLQRDVTYLSGDQDHDTVELDDSCPALLQGPTRHTRAEYFFADLSAEFKNHLHQFVSVPGIGHTEAGMFRSPEGRAVLFKDFFSNENDRTPTPKAQEIDDDLSQWFDPVPRL